ncbi:MAG: amylo-alpha-1,6-glucosidase [Bacteroidales bacterium]|nr:amylo-alpha-1,6-glucosidase [Bacteroidales bacterium]
MNNQPLDKNKLLDLRYSLKRELYKCNKLGACVSSSIILCNTKKWHSLLSVYDEEINCQKILLSAIDDSILSNGKSFYLSTRKYPNVYYPLGHQYLYNVDLNPVPTIWYNIGNILIKKEILLSSNENTVYIKYTLEESENKVTLQIRPLLGFRKALELNRRQTDIFTSNKEITHGISYSPNSNESPIYLQMSLNCEFVTAPDWNYNIEYSEDRMSGLPYQEDLFMPGFFEVDLSPNSSVIFCASTKKQNVELLNNQFNEEFSSRKKRESYNDDLYYAASQMIRERKGKFYIVNSLPEKIKYSKKIFMALPGLTLPFGNIILFKNIINSCAKHLKNSIFAQPGDKDFSPDSLLWYIWAIQQYNFQTGNIKETYKEYGKTINKIIKTGLNNRIPGLLASNDGLLAIKKGGDLVYNIEINALWYNALLFSSEMNAFNNEEEMSELASKAARKVKQTFNTLFKDPSIKYLVNNITDEGEKDLSCCPEQILAFALPFSVADNDLIGPALAEIEDKLLTPRGLRTTSLDNPLFGNNWLGYVSPEYSGFLAELYLKVKDDESGLKKAEEIYRSLIEDSDLPSSPCFYERYEPGPPYNGAGSPINAVAIAAIYRTKLLIEQY